MTEAFQHIDLLNVVHVIHQVIFMYLMVTVANIVDMVDAIVTSHQLGQKLQSAKLRHALTKLGKYWLVLALPVCFDSVCAVLDVYRPAYGTGIITASILLIEGWSMKEHMKCRRDKTAKIPQMLQEIAEFVGEDEIKTALMDMLKRKVKAIGGETADNKGPKPGGDVDFGGGDFETTKAS